MKTALVTGGAGFIGSHLVRGLLDSGYAVRVLDDFSTGFAHNLDGVDGALEVSKGSVCDRSLLDRLLSGVDCVFHQAALPSVPRSIEAPWPSHEAIVNGTLTLLLAARDAGVRRVVCASSSSVYGNAARYPVDESMPLAPISPYAVMKTNNEHYARVFHELYGLDAVCLRYFNVFGPRQNPDSNYAAAIPIFIRKMRQGEPPPVYGDGTQARDFTFVENVVQANLAVAAAPGVVAGSYNVAGGQSISVLTIIALLNDILGTALDPAFLPPRAGDIHTSYADVSKAVESFGFDPAVGTREGLERTVAWFEAME